MEQHRLQLSVASLLWIVACIAFNIWLFRFGALLGLIGLNISKHVLIAVLCRNLGVDRTGARNRSRALAGTASQIPVS